MISNIVGVGAMSLGVIDPATVPLASGDVAFGVVLAFAIGGLLLYVGWHQYRTKRLVEDTPTESVRSVAVGRTALSGATRPRDEAFDQPFADGEAVVATYQIEEYEPNGQHDTSDWRKRAGGRLLEPFVLDDGTGQIAVDPDDSIDLIVSDENTTQFEVGEDDEIPAAARRFLETETELDPDHGGLDLHEKKRRYTQEVIPPGTEVYLFGGVRAREDAGGTDEERLVVGPDEETNRFLLSDAGEDALTADLGSMAPLAIGTGVLLLAVGFFFAVTALGMAG